jgi:transposase
MCKMWSSVYDGNLASLGEDNDIGKSKIYNCKKCKNVYDRDVKSAGCIYLKALK